MTLVCRFSKAPLLWALVSSSPMPSHNGDHRRGGGSNGGRGGGATYKAQRIIGSGAFGVVYEAKVQETGETVAIKKVFQDKRFKNRELPTLKELKHPNIVALKHAFHTAGETPNDLYLNLVMEYVPDNLYQVMKYYTKVKSYMPSQLVKLYSYQILRAVGYVNAKGIAHRDIKPQNILVCPSTHTIKLCDFGSAKRLSMGEDNVAYICSRFYRAPELIFGATGYTNKVDIWSAGCVIAEMSLGYPLFPGESGVDQLVEIIKVLGTPTAEQVAAMNPKYKDFDLKAFPSIKPKGLANALRGRALADRGFEALLRVLLRFEPEARMSPILALCLDYFEQLRLQKDLGKEIEAAGGLPRDLFKFTTEELAEVGDPRRLAPRRVHAPQVAMSGGDADDDASIVTSHNHNHIQYNDPADVFIYITTSWVRFTGMAVSAHLEQRTSGSSSSDCSPTSQAGSEYEVIPAVGEGSSDEESLGQAATVKVKVSRAPRSVLWATVQLLNVLGKQRSLAGVRFTRLHSWNLYLTCFTGLYALYAMCFFTEKEGCQTVSEIGNDSNLFTVGMTMTAAGQLILWPTLAVYLAQRTPRSTSLIAVRAGLLLGFFNALCLAAVALIPLHYANSIHTFFAQTFFLADCATCLCYTVAAAKVDLLPRGALPTIISLGLGSALLLLSYLLVYDFLPGVQVDWPYCVYTVSEFISAGLCLVFPLCFGPLIREATRNGIDYARLYYNE
ncbi:hypothetical protein FOZ63_026420 [Perkinsus olseni]|uniref:Protein kinase domain-containing protein n=1 Tax=Perkinsus olseni TaxID=32597 RepID=A0A7J6UCE6_PEROL|nr:hypothetical protein FOZ63_026420 [Perkinsus olseni]